MVSFDVVSLFTSIPVDLAKDIVRRKLKESDIWQAHTDLTSSQILGLLAIVLDNSLMGIITIKYLVVQWVRRSAL